MDKKTAKTLQGAILRRNIRRRLSQLDETVSSLKAKTGQTSSAIQNIMSGRSTDPSLATLIVVAEVLNVDLDWISGHKAYKDLPHSLRPATSQDAENVLEAEGIRKEAKSLFGAEKAQLLQLANRLDWLDEPFPEGAENLLSLEKQPEIRPRDDFETRYNMQNSIAEVLNALHMKGLANLDPDECSHIALAATNIIINDESTINRAEMVIDDIVNFYRKSKKNAI